jgi:hypothetical protein
VAGEAIRLISLSDNDKLGGKAQELMDKYARSNAAHAAVSSGFPV